VEESCRGKIQTEITSQKWEVRSRENDVSSIPAKADGHASLEDVERRHVESVLNQTNWMIEGERGAAKILNLNPSTLRSRMKNLGIKRPAKL
jgi:transcriptional regulator with GAF, ATPase, and Fis domain